MLILNVYTDLIRVQEQFAEGEDPWATEWPCVRVLCV